MHLPLSAIAVAASLLASTATALSPSDIPSDQPVTDLLSSAQSHLSRGETSEALIYYDAAVAKDPKNYMTLFKRATTYLVLGRTNQAADDFSQVLNLKPGFEGAHIQLAKIKARIADWDGARNEYLAAQKTVESAEVAELDQAHEASALAEKAAEAKQWDDCITHAGTAIFVASRSPALREVRAKCRFAKGEMEEGMGDLQHVLNMKPGNTTPHVVISATSFYALADTEAGLNQIRKCLHSDPESKICKKLHKKQKTVAKQLRSIERSLNLNQPSTAGKALVGTAEEPGLVAVVKEQIEELRHDGHIPEKAQVKLYENLVEMVCQAYVEGSHKNTQTWCGQAEELNPDSFWALLHKGKKLFKEDEFEPAIHTLNKAAELRPDLKDKVYPILQKAQVALKRSKTKDYYKVLEVASDADERQIKSAYRKASKTYHPDKAAKLGLNKEAAEKKMAGINEAYEVLSDPELRARFDAGDDPNNPEQRGSPFQGSPFGGHGHPFGGGFGGQQFFQQGGGGGGGGGSRQFKFNFGGQGGNPFGF